MKVFLSSTYNDLIEHRRDENQPRMGQRMYKWGRECTNTIRVFV